VHGNRLVLGTNRLLHSAPTRAMGRKQKPLLSELHAGAGVAGAGEGPAEVEKDVEEHQDTEIVCFAGTRSWVVCAKIPR
jgi:hypothetical protein